LENLGTPGVNQHPQHTRVQKRMANASNKQYLQTVGNDSYRISWGPGKNHVNRKHVVK